MARRAGQHVQLGGRPKFRARGAWGRDGDHLQRLLDVDWQRGTCPTLWADVAAELALYLSRPHPERYDHLRKYLGSADPEPSGPLLVDLVAGYGALDSMLDQVLHHAGVPPDDLSVRRVVSYCDNLTEMLRTDCNVYGLGTSDS